MEKLIGDKLKPTMLDPSLLIQPIFWKSAQKLNEVFPTIYIPQSINKIKNPDFREFYGSYLRESDIMNIDKVIRNAETSFEWFSWEDYSKKVPEQYKEHFGALRRDLEKSNLSSALQNILLDEFVFLTTQSSILSRIKKTFKLFEKLEVFPLINLENIVPEEWQKSVSGIKKTVDIVNWIGTIGAFAIWLDPVIGVISGSTVTGVRLLLIDP